MKQPSRTARVERLTKETSIAVEVNLDGEGAYDVSTGMGFLDITPDAFVGQLAPEIDLGKSRAIQPARLGVTRGGQDKCHRGQCAGKSFSQWGRWVRQNCLVTFHEYGGGQTTPRYDESMPPVILKKDYGGGH